MCASGGVEQQLLIRIDYVQDQIRPRSLRDLNYRTSGGREVVLSGAGEGETDSVSRSNLHIHSEELYLGVDSLKNRYPSLLLVAAFVIT